MIGGTETQAVELARRLDPARYRVTIGCLRKEGPLLSRLEGSGVRVIEFSLGKGIDTASGIAGMLSTREVFCRVDQRQSDSRRTG